MKKIIDVFILLISLLSLGSCSDYLDVVPDNIPTIDHAFNNRINAEKYLFTCYSYLPNPTSPNTNPGFLCGYESWITEEGTYYWGSLNSFNAAKIGQNSNNPLLNYWDGGNDGHNLFVAIRDCNIFLENIDKPVDLEEYEKVRWVAEAKFLKAYYHYYLLRLYGPIPIIEKNLPVSASPEEVRVYRDPVDDVVNYIVQLLDEAVVDLPDNIQIEIEEMGRVTKSIALALKAKTLVLNASPLFNGNPYYTNLKDNQGRNLFSTSYDAGKWEVAAKALKEAIDFAESQGAELYYYKGFDPVTDSTRQKLNISKEITERWNKEIIWGSTKNDNFLQKVSFVRTKLDQKTEAMLSLLSPTIRSVERFYTKNGVPINEDKEWDYENRYKITEVAEQDCYYMKTGYKTARLNIAREPRFYASLSFDGAIVYGNGIVGDNDYSKLTYAQMKKGQPGGMIASQCYSITGYLPKKLVAVETVGNQGTFTSYRYSYPVIRLADLYLLYAEALNEIKSSPDAEVYQWIDKVRKRASLKGVVESWTKYSTMPNKVSTQDGMREIIHRERLIELAFEGETFWDLLRWKEAGEEFKHPIQGWNVSASDTESYYKIQTIANPSFSIKNYFFPIKQASIDVNPNLVQNFGWGSTN